MPTPSRAFAAVAEALADIDARDGEAVTLFYRRKFVEYPLPIRALISDFLAGHTGMPSAAALKALKEAVAGPVDEIPEIEAPVWHGAPMEYSVADGKKVAAGG